MQDTAAEFSVVEHARPKVIGSGVYVTYGPCHGAWSGVGRGRRLGDLAGRREGCEDWNGSGSEFTSTSERGYNSVVRTTHCPLQEVSYATSL